MELIRGNDMRLKKIALCFLGATTFFIIWKLTSIETGKWCHCINIYKVTSRVICRRWTFAIPQRIVEFKQRPTATVASANGLNWAFVSGEKGRVFTDNLCGYTDVLEVRAKGGIDEDFADVGIGAQCPLDCRGGQWDENWFGEESVEWFGFVVYAFDGENTTLWEATG